ncbi:MAG: transglutaminase-like domain-containing protein, partial [Myxococcota bacterium]|nr:transglutaminase-like domain-containing protein [Myxococcota bacterium]
PTPLVRPAPRGDAGTIALRGRLPAGEAIVPLPLYARVSEVRVGTGEVEALAAGSGAIALRLEEASDVRLRLSLGRVPDLDRALPMRNAADSLATFVPDDELPDEAHAIVAANGDDDDAPIVRALALRDFVRERYRYDPTYLEDASVGRWLARVTRGRANVHVAALHAASDATHLGAGVCYELNVLACELLRRAGIPAVIAAGWVYDGGALSEPDHLWAIALLEDDAGAPVWVPIDASTTREGRPLRVPRRPPGRFRAPRDPLAKAPSPVRWDLGRSPRPDASPSRGGERIKRKRTVPRAELARVLHHLGQLAGRPLGDAERAEVERALSDPRAAAALLDRLREP